MEYVLSDSTFDKIENIELEAHNKIIEVIAEDLCQKRVSRPTEGSFWEPPVVTLDSNGPFHIEAIINYDSNTQQVMAEVYDDNMENKVDAVITTTDI